MADRYDLLTRLATALSRPGVDGVLGTPDIIDDLALLGCLDDKIVVGSMNRGGLRGASFEMDDRYTAYNVDSIVRDGLDFAKNLIRINLADAGTADTLESSALAVDDAAAAKLPIMLEPFMSEWVNGAIKNNLTTDEVIKSVAIVSGLGNSSAYSWLKLPVVPGMDRVMAATTLPTLLLGGDPAEGEQERVFSEWAEALKLPGVRGLVIGRSILYPEGDDVAAAIDAAAKLVHSN
jgi:DhnA family fructose-bisphosphate aldolase class Ia